VVAAISLNKKINMNKYISNQIKSIRKSKSLNQSEMAEKLKISHRYYQKIESGRIDLKISLIQRISGCLNIDPCSLFTDNSPQLILENLHLGFVFQNIQGQLTYINKFMRDLWNAQNINLSQNIHYPWDFARDEEQKNILIKRFNEIINSFPSPTPFITEITLKDGKTVSIRNDWNYHLDPLNQKIIGLISIISLHSIDIPNTILFEEIVKDLRL